MRKLKAQKAMMNVKKKGFMVKTMKKSLNNLFELQNRFVEATGNLDGKKRIQVGKEQK